jgi:leucyl/phenylalanyl-tRNA--protein transferase
MLLEDAPAPAAPEPIPPAPPRHMQALRTRDASDHYAMYCAGFYVTCDRQTGEFYWDRRDDRWLVDLTPDNAAKARQIMKKEVRVPVRCTFNTSPSGVFDHLQNPAIKPRTWVSAEVRTIYEELISAGHAFTMEAFHDDELVGGLIGISIGAVAIIDTMYGLPEPRSLRSASKALLCHTVIEFQRIGVTCIDVQNRHPDNHPWQRLGERQIGMSELRQLFASQSQSQLEIAAAMNGWCSPE